MWFRSCPTAWRRECRSYTPEHAAAASTRTRSARRLIERSSSSADDVEIAEIVDRFRGERGRRSGLATEGLIAVCAALREDAVGTLIVGDLGAATVVTGKDRATVAPDADVLSELGEAVHRVVRADEALPFAAITVGASLVRVDDGITPADGIAALLRYAPTDAIDSDAHAPSLAQ